MRLVDFSKGYLRVLYEIPIPKGSKIRLSFSPDGKYFVLFFKKLNILQIWEINDDLIGLMKRIDSEELPAKEYTNFNGAEFL